MDVDGSGDMEAITIGVDFGAANVRVGRWIDGKFQRITDESGTDAFLAFFGRKYGQNFFGQEAREMSAVDPANVIFDVVQFVGLDAEQARYKSVYGMYPFRIRDLRDYRDFDFQLSNRTTISLMEVIQCFLERMYMLCEKLFGLQEFSLALTIPSYWNKSIRQYKETKLLEAARRSGFTRASLIDSQVAATLGCYLVMKDSKTWVKDILVVDVGATDITATVSRTQFEDETETEDENEDDTVDYTEDETEDESDDEELQRNDSIDSIILRKRQLRNRRTKDKTETEDESEDKTDDESDDETKGKTEDETNTRTFTVTGVGLGCTSVDRALMRYLKEQFIVKHRLPVDTAVNLTAWHLFRMECEKARVCLSSTLTTILFVPNFALGYDLHVELTRDTFDDVAGLTIAEDVVGITEQVLALSNINIELCSKDDFRLFLVGGGTRIPCIRQRMDTEFVSRVGPDALLHREDAAVIGAAGYARMIALESDVINLDIVQHYRDLCDFFENYGTPPEDGASRLVSCRSGCTHASARRTLVLFDRMTSIIPSMHGISAKTDGVSYRFSIKKKEEICDYAPNYIKDAWLYNVELTQATAASLGLQQSHMNILSFVGTFEQEDLTGTGAFGNFEGRICKIRNPLDLCHPNVVRCLAVGRTTPMREHQFRDQLAEDWRPEEKYIRMLLDMRLGNNRGLRYPFSLSGLDVTLHRYCEQRGSSLENKDIIIKTKQLLKGLSYLHGLEIPLILGNLTSSGILVTPDGETVKIWDILFGLRDKSSLQLDFEVSLSYNIQDLAYAHPDVLSYIAEISLDHEECSTLTFQPYMDIWSLGCVVLDMVSRGQHFSCNDKHGVLLDYRIRNEDFVRTMTEGGVPLIPSSAPDIIRLLCTKCFERKPGRRTDALGLLEMISKIPENEIDVCTRDKASPKQPSMFAVSKGASYEFNYLSILGVGSYGCVYAVDLPKNDVAESSVDNDFPEEVDNKERNGRKLALRILNNCRLKRKKADLLLWLSHDHVVKYISFGTLSNGPGNMAYETPQPAILMEYCTGGNLNSLARQQELSATEILDYARQIASGLAYLHGVYVKDYVTPFYGIQAPIMHGNLNGGAILLTSEKRRTAKIIGIDGSVILESEKMEIEGVRFKDGTLTHMSPEMVAFLFADKDVEDTNIHRATDIWSLGCTILEMFGRGDVAYSKKDGSNLVIKPEKVKQFANSVSLGAHPDLSVADDKGIQPEFRQILEECLQREPQNRPKASDLLKRLTTLQLKISSMYSPLTSDMEAITIGVDFGAANVRVGRWIDGRFERITDEFGADAFPAFFGRKDGHDFFGQEAREMSTVDPANVIFDVIQFVGLNAEEARYKNVYGMYPFKICDLSNSSGEFEFQLSDGSTVSPIEVIQRFLKHVHMQCEKLFGLREFSLAFTVPSYWGELTRKYKKTKLLDAAQLSGFTRASLIDSQVAATLGCYLVMKNSKTWLKDILVVDVGATNITATVSRAQFEDETETETFTVTGVGLGCTSVDRALMRHLKEQFIAEHRLPVDTTVNLTAWHLLRMECEKARVCLTTAMVTVLSVPNFAVGRDLNVGLTRDMFDTIVGSTIAEDVVSITKQVLTLSKINVELSTENDLQLFLVGGGSRIPCIRQRMDVEFGSKISAAAYEIQLRYEDSAVIGAARYARMIALEPNVMKLDIVQHYRDLCNFFENDGTPWQIYGASRLVSCRSGCIHESARRTLVHFDWMTSIIPSRHRISAKLDRVSYRFSINDDSLNYVRAPLYIKDARLYNVELTQATAESLQLQERHVALLCFRGRIGEEDPTGIGAFGNFEKRISKVRNPLDLDHPHVVRCLAIGCTAPMREWQVWDKLWYTTQRLTESYTHILLDMQLDPDPLARYPFSYSGSDTTLYDFCEKQGSSLEDRDIINKTKQLLDGLSYLHRLEIPFILGSLTSSGILVTPDGKTVKIWDIFFGIQDKSPSQLRISLGEYPLTKDLAYAHPDVSNYIAEIGLDHEECSTLTFQPYMDIWSLGCVVLDMVSRDRHFKFMDRYGIPLSDKIAATGFAKIMSDGGAPLIPASASEIIRLLCTRCFKREGLRADAPGLLEMIRQIQENNIVISSSDEAKLKQWSLPLFTVSNEVFFEFKWVENLGGGTYGDVYAVDIPEDCVKHNFPEAVALEIRNEKKLALKILNKSELAKTNGDLLVRLSHENVVKYVTTGTLAKGPDTFFYKDSLTGKRKSRTGVLMEHCPGGNLNQLAQLRNLSAVEILDFTRQIASGLAYLHNNRDMENLLSILGKPIAHGDLKGQNIFLTSGTPATAKIGDLDSLVILEKGHAYNSGLHIKEGTFTHMSPEMAAFVLRSDDEEDTDSVPTNIGRATDIYSFGCIILEMFGRGNVPYSKKDGTKLKPQVDERLAKSVVAGAHPDLSVANAENIPSDFLELLERCLQRDPKKRPIAPNLLKELDQLHA